MSLLAFSYPCVVPAAHQSFHGTTLCGRGRFAKRNVVAKRRFVPFACLGGADPKDVPEADDSGRKLSQSEKMAALLGRDVEKDAAKQKAESAALRVENERSYRTRLGLAGASFLVGLIWAAVEMNNPESAVALLRDMEMKSAPKSVLIADASTPDIARKPVFIDFYATWCTNCKSMASDISKVEKSRLGSEVYFISVDVDKPENADLVDQFQVDGIPHMAMVGKDGKVKATMIGIVPRNVIEKDLEALVEGKDEVPYPGSFFYDVELDFESQE